MKAIDLIAVSIPCCSVIYRVIGRFDDSFNLNCIGDFSSNGSSTLLFEAGHFEGDYQREIRKYILWH
jgi:hypothetical protein